MRIFTVKSKTKTLHYKVPSRTAFGRHERKADCYEAPDGTVRSKGRSGTLWGAAMSDRTPLKKSPPGYGGLFASTTSSV